MRKPEFKKMKKLKKRHLENVIGGASGVFSSPSFASLGVSITTTPCNDIWGPANEINFYWFPQGGIVSVDKRGTDVKQVNYAVKDPLPTKAYADNWMGGSANFKAFYMGHMGGSWPGWGTATYK